LGSAVAEAVRGKLGEVIAGLTPGRITDDEIVVFDSTGTPCRMWPWRRRFMSAQWRGAWGETIRLLGDGRMFEPLRCGRDCVGF
jgi:ornithine cyclodeaminase/alanine dehydrogenase-like protein (mu-crystallin family)